MPVNRKAAKRSGAVGRRRVLVEIRGNVGVGLGMAHGLAMPGFAVDDSYGAVPLGGPSVQGMAAEDMTFVIRGEVGEDAIQELESKPGVVGVWTDAEIAPFVANQDDVQMAPSDCPIPPCDCASHIPKGTISDVVNYLKVNQVWAQGYNGSGIIVGIVDGGITAQGRPISAGDTSASDWPNKLIPNVTAGWPVATWGTTGVGWGWHGNMTATDAKGIAPGIEIYDLRIADAATSTGVVSNALAAFQWALDTFKATGKPQILSNSWGMWQKSWAADYATNPNHPFTKKVVEAIDAGMIVLFAAGNCGLTCGGSKCGTDKGPGKSIWGANGHPRVMTVGAVNKNEQFIGYSSQGPAALDPKKPDFCGISHFTGFFNSDSGTSAACPVVAGVAALMKHRKPAATHDQIKKCLQNSAKDIGPGGWDPHSGFGIVQGKAAVDCISGGGILTLPSKDTISVLDLQTISWRDRITISILDKITLPVRDKITTSILDKITTSILDKIGTSKVIDDVKRPYLDKIPISDLPRIPIPERLPTPGPLGGGSVPFVLSTPHHAANAEELAAQLADPAAAESMAQQCAEALKEIEQALAEFDAAASEAANRAATADAELNEIQTAYDHLVEQYQQVAAELKQLTATPPPGV